MNEFPISVAPKTKSIFEITVNVVLTIVVIVLAFQIMFYVCFSRVYVVGQSMSETLNGAENKDVPGGDFVYIDKFLKPKYGDIVVIEVGEKSNNTGKEIIKRVIALGGDTVEIRNGTVYRNGDAIDEPYVLPRNNRDKISQTYPLTTVPEGKLFFLGDNRDNSTDSRSDKYGMVDEAAVIGVVSSWSLNAKALITDINTFFVFTVPGWFF